MPVFPVIKGGSIANFYNLLVDKENGFTDFCVAR